MMVLLIWLASGKVLQHKSSELSPEHSNTLLWQFSKNLAMYDTIKQWKLTKDIMDATHDISKLLKFSPKCSAIFDKLKQELSPDILGFRVLCSTCWTVRAKGLQSVQNNYSVMQEL